jgi:hypothetical protein
MARQKRVTAAELKKLIARMRLQGSKTAIDAVMQVARDLIRAIRPGCGWTRPRRRCRFFISRSTRYLPMTKTTSRGARCREQIFHAILPPAAKVCVDTFRNVQV